MYLSQPLPVFVSATMRPRKGGMQEVILGLVLDSGFLSHASFMAVARSCTTAYALSERRRKEYEQIVPVIKFLRHKLEVWEKFAYLWRHEGGVCTFPENYWHAIQPMSPMQHALYYAIMMLLFPCQGGLIRDGVVEWLCILHPSTLCIKHLPSYHGYVYMHGKHSDISFPAYVPVVEDAVLLSFHTDVHAGKTCVFVEDCFCVEQPRVTAATVKSRVDIRALSKFLATPLNVLFDVDELLPLVTRIE